MKSLTRNMAFALIAALALNLTTQLSAAQDTNPKGATEESQPAKRSQFPFHGKLSAIDKEAQTISIAGKEKTRVIQVTAKTKITKAGKTAKLEDAVVGDEVAGLITKNGGQKEEAISLRLGPKAENSK